MQAVLDRVVEATVVLIIAGVVSLRFKLVDRGGLLAGFIVGYWTYLFGGRVFFFPLLAFHMSAGLFTKFRYQYKRERGAAEEKRGARGWRNVTANGGVPLLYALLANISQPSISQQLTAAYFAALCSASADTLATEIGLLYRGDPLLITSLKKKVPPGTPGGVTIFGEIGQVFSAVIIILVAISASFFSETKLSAPSLAPVVLFSSIFGPLIDSFMGATLQGRYRCSNCGKITENKVHCNVTGKKVAGIGLIDNNIVNAASIFSISVLVLILAAVNLLPTIVQGRA